MEFLGPPDKIIAGFGPELFGAPLNDGDVTDTTVYKKGNDTYYQWDLKPHRKVVATATGNRVCPHSSSVIASTGFSRPISPYSRYHSLLNKVKMNIASQCIHPCSASLCVCALIPSCGLSINFQPRAMQVDDSYLHAVEAMFVPHHSTCEITCHAAPGLLQQASIQSQPD